MLGSSRPSRYGTTAAISVGMLAAGDPTPNPPATRARRTHGDRMVAKWNYMRRLSTSGSQGVEEAYFYRPVCPSLHLISGVDQRLYGGNVYLRSRRTETINLLRTYRGEDQTYTPEKSSTIARNIGLTKFSAFSSCPGRGPGSFHGRSLSFTALMSFPRRIFAFT